MPYARPIFASLAALFCLCLGGVSLLQNNKSPLHRNFAFFNFAVALANFGELAVFIPNPWWRLWLFRLVSLNGCWVLPFFLRFSEGFIEEIHKETYRKILGIIDVLAVFLAVMFLTPLMYVRFDGGQEISGPLFPFFVLYLLSAVGVIVYFVHLFRKNRGLHRQQIGYMILASLIGLFALFLFLLSFLFPYMPRTYYPLQALYSFVFAYAIFKHSLIPARIVLRRVMLAVGIYVAIFMALVPITYSLHRSLSLQGGAHIFDVLNFLVLIGAIFSIGPILYSILLQQSRVFHEKRISEITHEFQTPIAAIQGVYDVLDEEMGKPDLNRSKVSDYLTMLKENTSRLEKFVDDVLIHARSDHSDQPRPALVEMGDVVKEVLTGFPEFSTRFHFGQTGDTSLIGFSEGLKQIINNLVSNALKFCPDGFINVEIVGRGDKLFIEVRDGGIGIAPEHIGRVFEPFFKVGPAPGRARGAGLGLSIVKKWVDLHHGTVWVESDGSGCGTTFHVSLPKK